MTKTDFDAKFKKISDRVTSNKSKHLLLENELKVLEKFDAAYFRGNYFEEDGTQMFLVFQPMPKYFGKRGFDSGSYISSWESKGLSRKKLVLLLDLDMHN